LALAIGLGLLFGIGLLQVRPVWATLLAAAATVLLAAAAYFCFKYRLTWFAWLIIVVQIALALFWSILFNSIQLYVQKRLYEQTLRLYLPPKLVAKFAKTRDFLKPGARKQTLTLLFSDIANFTSTSEGMDSDELAAMMNAYFDNAVAKCIHKAEGTVAKYIGDAIFAFWNAPDEQSDHALLACQAALLFRDSADQPIKGRVLPTRIGLHTGTANVGNFGSVDRVDYTALGDSVNLASRLEGLNKHLGTVCLISGTTKAAAGERVITRGLGDFQLKGFEGLVEVHELVGRPDEAETTRAWREAFAEALTNFEHRNLEFAEIGFRRVLELKPGDGPSKFYLNRISELAAEALPDNWATFTILKEK
jgi:adenylate cyclase